MNTADSEGIARKLLAAGYVEESLERADIAILNTCVVRQASEERVYSKLHELRQWKTPERTPRPWSKLCSRSPAVVKAFSSASRVAYPR